jgi:ParB family chromosome partitioning protein
MTIAASMNEYGQLEPIMIRRVKKQVFSAVKTKLFLVDGDHRLRAAKSLGWTHISAVGFEGDERAAELYEALQNTQRANNTVLDRAKFINRYVHLKLGKVKTNALASRRSATRGKGH